MKCGLFLELICWFWMCFLLVFFFVIWRGCGIHALNKILSDTFPSVTYIAIINISKGGRYFFYILCTPVKYFNNSQVFLYPCSVPFEDSLLFGGCIWYE